MVTNPSDVITITIDGRTVTVLKGTTVYQAARGAGIDIPIFCYHDRMPPLGACRMCLVKVEKMPKLQTSCTLPATEGMVVDTVSADVKVGQEAILEFLLINHPLDCPICDKGGECPLQDQTYRWGPGHSRFVEAKRDFAKPVSLGPVLALDRERCILCWRCVRFGEIIAGDDALKGFERGFTSEINTPFTLPVESKFIGNTIAICPVGALTSKTYRFRARPWDNQAVPTTCTHCGIGCAIWLDVRDGQITRTRARELGEVNDIWLCDRGFFGHDYVGADDRLTTPLVRRGDRLVEAGWDEALEIVAARIRASLDRGRGRIAFLGGRRLSNEDALVAGKFFRGAAGTPHLDHRVDAPPGSAALDTPWGLRASIEEIGRGDVFVLVGCDLTEEYPVLWLRIKHAVDRGAKLIIAHPKQLEIARYASHVVTPSYDAFPVVCANLPADAVRTIGAGQRVHVFLGRTALDAPFGRTMLTAACELAGRANGVLHVLRGHGNDFGAHRFGLTPQDGGWSAPEILRHAAAGDVDVLYIAGSDPATAVTDGSVWAAARRGAGFVVVHEAFLSRTAQEADVVFPALVLPEKAGTVTNVEGRTLPLTAAVQGPGQARDDREIFGMLAGRLGHPISFGTADEVLNEMRAIVPGLAVGALTPIPPVPPRAAASAGPAPSTLGRGAPGDASPSGDAGGLWVILIDRLFTHGSMTGRSRGIRDLAGAPSCSIHPDDAARLGVIDRALVEIRTPHGAVVVQARVSRETPLGHVLLPYGHDEVPVQTLLRWPDTAVRAEVRTLLATGAPR